MDSDGRRYDVVDWQRIPSFKSISGFLLLITGTIFAAPVLANERRLSLPEFKKTIAGAMRGRYRYDLDKYPGVETVRKLKVAETYAEAMDAVPKL